VVDVARDWDQMILVGVIARTHGNRGEVIVNLTTDFPEERFRPGARLFMRRPNAAPEALDVTAVRFHQGRPVLQIRGVDSIGAAEIFASAEIRIPAEDQGALPDGVYYHSDLVGCEVITAAGEAIGSVATVEGEGATSRLVVKSRRGEVLIPFAEDICHVDLAARRITVTPPEGLLELNGEWR
jgi:16S rRNA processing protein RimM